MYPDHFDKEDLIRCGHGQLFPGAMRLPIDEMLMVDRITHIGADDGEYGKGSLVAELDINPDLWFFKVHFEGDPVMPGCLGLDAMWQLVGFFLAWSGGEGKGRALGAGEHRRLGEPARQIPLLLKGAELGEHKFAESTHLPVVIQRPARFKQPRVVLCVEPRE